MLPVKISGFSFIRDGDRLYYPFCESIRSILPICDEFVIAVGKGREGDTTREQIAAIGDPKIRIIDTVWDEKECHKGAIHAIQTDVAMKACSGDWLFYVQGDEVVHEKYLPVIQARCEELLEDREVDGLLFRYKHFWGDYRHHLVSSAWYNCEIRMVRNVPDMHSWHSAQSFRRIPEYVHPWQDRSTANKLRVARVDAEIFHYGWVRPPVYMQKKTKQLTSNHHGASAAEAEFAEKPAAFRYGPLDKLAVYEGTHPEVMSAKVATMDWADDPDTWKPPLEPHKHERFKYRFRTGLERMFFGGEQVFSSRNFELLKDR